MTPWKPSKEQLEQMISQFFVNWAKLEEIANNLGRIATVLERMDARTQALEAKYAHVEISPPVTEGTL